MEKLERQACYTVKELTMRLCASGVQVTERTVQRWLRARGVRAERMGNAWVYWEADLKDRCASAMASLGILLDD